MDYKEKVIALLNSKDLSKEQKEKLESIFPELAKSEDERIRKALISFLKSPFVNENITDEKVTPWIAWLEKQGEQILNNSAKTCKDGQKPIKNHNVCDFCEDRYGCVNTCPTKLIEEQKPVDFSALRTWKYIVDAVWTEKEGIGQYLDSPFTEEVAKKLQKRFGKIEQKSADKVDQYSLPVSDNSSLPTFDESIYHPCTEEVYEQKPNKWSEEDIMMKGEIINVLQKTGNYEKEINWLKSLKERCTWKPSDEQMIAINTAINVLGKGTLNGKQLIELQEQLMKLRGE